MTEGTKNGLKAAAIKAMSDPKKVIVTAAALIEFAPALAAVGAVGAAGVGLVKLLKKRKENQEA